MSDIKYDIHDELVSKAKFKLPQFVMTRLGSNICNVFIGISCLFVKEKIDIKATKLKIKGYKSREISIIIYEPITSTSNMPCLVYYHGGGFSLKASKGAHDMAMAYASGANCKVVFVNYRTSANHLFPTSVEDCYESAKYIIANYKEIGIDKNKVAVGGDSAGGALAINVAQMLLDRDCITLKFQFLIYPVTDTSLKSASMIKYTDTPIWHSELNKKMWKLYLRNIDISDQMYINPIERDDFEGLPNAYIEVTEFDCLHDEGILYADKLINAKIDVVKNELKGAFHGFDSFQDNKMVKEVMVRRIDELIKGFN